MEDEKAREAIKEIIRILSNLRNTENDPFTQSIYFELDSIVVDLEQR